MAFGAPLFVAILRTPKMVITINYEKGLGATGAPLLSEVPIQFGCGLYGEEKTINFGCGLYGEETWKRLSAAILAAHDPRKA